MTWQSNLLHLKNFDVRLIPIIKYETNKYHLIDFNQFTIYSKTLQKVLWIILCTSYTSIIILALRKTC